MDSYLLQEEQREISPVILESHTSHARPKTRIWQKLAVCGLLAVLALVIHGYHPFSEDAAVYVPAIKKQLDPSLYPQGAQFFLSPAQYSVFSPVIAASIRVLHLPFGYGLLGWYFASVFALLLGCWQLCEVTMTKRHAGLFGTMLMTCVLTIPVAGTSLLLMDPYLTSRSLCTPTLLFATCAVMEDRLWRALAWLGIALLIHPLMAAYGAVFLLILAAIRRHQCKPLLLIGVCVAGFLAVVAELVGRTPVPPSYRAAVLTRTYFFLQNWTWYELMGIAAPLGIFGWLAWRYRTKAESRLYTCSTAILAYGLAFTVAGIAISFNQNLMMLARYQPMRSFHLVYILLFLIPVNLVWQRLASRRSAIAALIVVAVAVTMFTAQRASFPATAHIEWPGTRSDNPWQQAFEWVRVNTPKNAVFALAPDYMDEPTEDHHGFRAYAERSTLADRAKDGGVAALFPGISDTWLEQSSASSRLLTMSNEAQASPLIRSGATWFITRNPVQGFECPYRKAGIAVCNLQTGSMVAKERHSKAGALASHN